MKFAKSLVLACAIALASNCTYVQAATYAGYKSQRHPERVRRQPARHSKPVESSKGTHAPQKDQSGSQQPRRTFQTRSTDTSFFAFIGGIAVAHLFMSAHAHPEPCDVEPPLACPKAP